MKRVAVLQSNYIPWKGYFDIIHDVDEFIFYDEVQYTTRDWRSRNYIYGKNGLILLSVPCTGGREQAISQVKIQDVTKHFKTIVNIYSKSKYLEAYIDFFSDVYSRKWEYLSDLNQYIIKHIATDFLGVATQFTRSSDYSSKGVKHEKLLNLVKASGATAYISGPAAKNYIIEEDYVESGIEIIWKDYEGYPEYPQLKRPFEHKVSIVDLLFNCGDSSPYYIWGWRTANSGVSTPAE